MHPWLVWCAFFWQDIKLCPKPCFSGAVPPNSQEAVSWAIVLSLTQTNKPTSFLVYWLCPSTGTFSPSLSLTLGSHSTDLPNSKFLKTSLGNFLPVQLTSISLPSLAHTPQNRQKREMNSNHFSQSVIRQTFTPGSLEKRRQIGGEMESKKKALWEEKPRSTVHPSICLFTSLRLSFLICEDGTNQTRAYSMNRAIYPSLCDHPISV